MYLFESKRVPGRVIRASTERAAERFRRQGFVEVTPEPEPDDELDGDDG